MKDKENETYSLHGWLFSLYCTTFYFILFKHEIRVTLKYLQILVRDNTWHLPILLEKSLSLWVLFFSVWTWRYSNFVLCRWTLFQYCFIYSFFTDTRKQYACRTKYNNFLITKQRTVRKNTCMGTRGTRNEGSRVGSAKTSIS